MNDTIKICKVHGKLNKEDTAYYTYRYKEKISKYATCRICFRERQLKNYHKNIERSRQYNREYSKNNRDKLRINANKFKNKIKDENGERYKAHLKRYREYGELRRKDPKIMTEQKARNLPKERKSRQELKDSYVKRALAQQFNLNSKLLPKELIEMKRVLLQLKRKRKDLKNARSS